MKMFFSLDGLNNWSIYVTSMFLSINLLLTENKLEHILKFF